jgi:DNA uptake protein ComE-like DNA-binding protein
MRSDGRLAASASKWPWLSLLPLGLGAWAPIYAGVRARVASWIALGTAWSAITLAGWILASTAGGTHDIAGLMLIVGWIGAIATSFVIRGEYDRRQGSPLQLATAAAEQRLDDRRRAAALARENPSLAREVGVGRPDRPGALDAGVVDVNNAPTSALLGLPGIGDALATRIVELRAQTGGFSSVEDLGATADLSGDLVEGLRDRVVFLPRVSDSGDHRPGAPTGD